MIGKKCSICGEKGHFYVNGIPLCIKHEITEYYKNHVGCLEAYLDSFIDRLQKYGKLDKEEIEFLKILKIEMPEMVNEFPILFDELKKK